MAFELKYLGHSGFEFKIHNKSILIDPFLYPNQQYDYIDENIIDIFLTHGHSDHIGSAIDIAKRKRALITAVFELANYCSQKGTRANGVNIGGWINYEWGRVIFLPALHSSSTPDGIYAGVACGILFEIEGIKIYHTGDTGLSQEMKTVKELYKPDIVMLPIGGSVTMDIAAAAVATEWIGAGIVIPIHYNTFLPIKADVNSFKMIIEQKGFQCNIMQQNEIAFY